MKITTSTTRRLTAGITRLVACCGAKIFACLPAGRSIGWLVLLGFGSCAVTARGDVPEVWRTGIELDGLSYRAGQLCWKRDVSQLDYSRIQRCPSTGTTVRFAYYSGSTANRVRSRTAELDDDLNVYWASGGGQILSMGADASALTVLCPMETAGVLPPLVSVGQNRVFWAERFGTFGNDAKIFFVQTAGGERTLVRDLAAGEGGLRQIAALTDTRLVYLNGNHQLYVLEWAGGPWVTVPIAENVTGFTLGNNSLYFAQSIPATGAVQLRGVPSADLSGETTLYATIDGSAGLDVSELAVDSHALYWHEVRNVAGELTGPICRRTLPKGLVQTLTTNLPGAIFLVSDGLRIFWKDETHRQIMSLRVNAAARVVDLAVTGLDVFQILENPTNTVRRVAGKPSFARVFAQIVSAVPATSSITQAPLIQLRAFHTGTTTELAGSPLYPTRETELRTIFDRTQDPSAVDAGGRPSEGYFFRLPPEWTESGTIDVRAELNQAHVIRETNYANNQSTLTCAFERKAPIGMMVIPLRTHQGVISHYDRSYQPVLDRALTLLPTSRLDVRWCGGGPMEEYEFLLPYGPYEISKADNDTSWVLAKLWWRDYFSDDPDDIEALNGEVLWGSFFIPFANAAVGGIAQGYQLICGMELGYIPGSGVNTAYGGVITAHEIGHNFDRAHVNFPAGLPARPDPSYPYATNTFGPSSMIGYDPISQQLLANTAAGDLMSYAVKATPQMPMWPSDYTWQSIMDNIGNLPGSSPVPAAIPGPSDAPNSPTQLVLGMIHAGAATVNPVVQVPDSATNTRLAKGFKTANDSTTYQWRMVAADGSATLSSAYAFFENDGSDLLLAGQLPVDETTVRVELVTAANPLNPLGMVEGGGAPPVVNWLVPGANDSYAANGSINAKWSASDPEGRNLSYSLRYTHDAGAHWRVILSQSPEPLTTIPLADLPGGPAGSCKLQLIASDGIRSTLANSPAFAVGTKAPEAHILIEAETGRKPGLPALYVPVGQTVTLQGQGSDPEDGNIPAERLYWSIQGMQGGATGTDFRMESYPPGSYTVTLKAVDSESQAGTDSVLIVIEPKYVAASAGAPVLDGYTEDDDYAYDLQPQSILNRDGVRSPVRIVRNGGKLYLAVAGLPIGKDDNEYVAVTLDPQHSGGSAPSVGVRRFIIHADGRIVQEQGDGKGFVSLPGVRIFDARVGFNDTESWNAEFAMDLTALGVDAGQSVDLDVGFYQRDTLGDDAHWLGGTQWNQSASRASVVMGDNPEDPRDDDADGMSDEWERRHFGNTSHSAGEDSDGDGLDNGGEFLAGTDPTSSSSRFAASMDGKPSNVGELTMAWDSVAGRCYDVETSTDLVTFVPFRSGVIGTGGKLTVIIPKTSGQMFCRVHASLCR